MFESARVKKTTHNALLYQDNDGMMKLLITNHFRNPSSTNLTSCSGDRVVLDRNKSLPMTEYGS